MNVEKPIQVGVSEKATNNPPIEILVQNEATLAGLPKTWPEGTVAHTPGNVNRWKWQSGAWVAILNVDSLSDLSDVNITNPTNGQAIIYDGTAQKWVNGSTGGGGSNIYMFTTSYDEVHDRAYINATCAELRAAAEAGKYMLCVDTLDSGGKFDYFVYFVGTMMVYTSGNYSFSLTLYSPDGSYYSYVGDSPTANPYQYKDD